MKTCARITPAVVNGSVTPKALKAWPASPARPNAMSNAKPATVGGSTMGKSIRTSSRRLPGNSRIASSHATGSPNATTMAVAIPLVTRLRRSASQTIGSASRATIWPGETRSSSEMKGSTRKVASSRVTSAAIPMAMRPPGRAGAAGAGEAARPALIGFLPPA